MGFGECLDNVLQWKLEATDVPKGPATYLYFPGGFLQKWKALVKATFPKQPVRLREASAARGVDGQVAATAPNRTSAVAFQGMLQTTKENSLVPQSYPTTLKRCTSTATEPVIQETSRMELRKRKSESSLDFLSNSEQKLIRSNVRTFFGKQRKTSAQFTSELEAMHQNGQ